ncbi:Serine/threonine-protein kinase oca2 [Erysiphe necator]|nr:Serine/threonine-protein kinase oca2 [Erysiphe necator]
MDIDTANMSGRNNKNQTFHVSQCKLDSKNTSSTPVVPFQNSSAIRFAFTTDSKINLETKQPMKVASFPVDKFYEPSIQEQRPSRFSFEPGSLPISRVNSHEGSFRETCLFNPHPLPKKHSLHHSPRISFMHTPPITPAVTRSQDTLEFNSNGLTLPQALNVKLDPAAVTPQISPPAGSPTTLQSEDDSATKSEIDTTPASPVSEKSRPSMRAFSIGPEIDSVIPSRDTSPARTPAPTTYSRPFAPVGDVNDPYAADKRIPQSKNLHNLDSRFKFTALNSKNRSNTINISSVNISRSPKLSGDSIGTEKRSSRNFRENSSNSNEELSSTHSLKRGSMVDLKRFFKLGSRSKLKRGFSPGAPNLRLSSKIDSGKSLQQFPFGDDHALQSKYGKLGKVLGAGAGGSVRLMKRSSDGKTFAVKEFRARHSCESEKDYAKKVTAEFCIGSTLHHANIIETLDIVCEKEKWYEVMEYAPYDLFAIVMTGKMSKNEITCSFLQILNAVTYLHCMGLAHRDLKLDNVVVNEHGIMKIIDFGSASVFKYPFESGITKASGIVGSDPYLAPEVYEERKYDPQPADIWSLAIIYCCMTLRRFPWKLPRMTDNSYKLFSSAPSMGTERNLLSYKSTTDLVPTPESPPSISKKIDSSSTPDLKTNDQPSVDTQKKPEVIKGPWRLLRLLPRESRKIIGRMLEINPRKRALMSEIIEDPWVSGTMICTCDADGNVRHAPGHTHTLEPPAPQTGKQQPAYPAKKKEVKRKH